MELSSFKVGVAIVYHSMDGATQSCVSDGNSNHAAQIKLNFTTSHGYLPTPTGFNTNFGNFREASAINWLTLNMVSSHETINAAVIVSQPEKLSSLPKPTMRKALFIRSSNIYLTLNCPT